MKYISIGIFCLSLLIVPSFAPAETQPMSKGLNEELRKKTAKDECSDKLVAEKIVTVSSVEQLNDAVEKLQIGDVIELADGDYHDVKLIVKQSGTLRNPIEIRAKDAGKVVFCGDIKVELRGNHTKFGGINFKNGARNPKEWRSHGQGLVAIYGDYCHVVDCLFTDFDKIPSAYITTSLDENGRVPQYAHIEYCAFVGKTTLDQVINFNNTPKKSVDGEPGKPMYHRINNCYFSNPKKKGNAGGGIRIGYWRKDYGRCLIDNNLFERQDSEAEIVTSKSMENVFYNNTFLNCQGTLNFRHGDKQVAINNFFIGTDTKYQYGGMYIWGSNHIIACNHFQLSSTLKARGNSAIYFNAGPEGVEHALAHSMLVINNNFIDVNGTDINFATAQYDARVKSYGRDKVKDPYGIDFVNNRFISENPKARPLINDRFDVAPKQTWIANVYKGMENGLKGEIDGLKRINSVTLRYDDSTVYVENIEPIDPKLITKYLPYNNIKGIDLDFTELIKDGTTSSPLTHSQVGPRWYIWRLKPYM